MISHLLCLFFLFLTSLSLAQSMPQSISSLEKQQAYSQLSQTPLKLDPPTLQPDLLKLLKAKQPIKVIIDAGHGGHDKGAQGYFGVSEKVLCLKVGKQVGKDLKKLAKKQGIHLEVQLTRTKDVFLTLGTRVQKANHWNADLFVSIHANASIDRRASGFEVYFLSAESTDADVTTLAQIENQGQSFQIKSTVKSILNDLVTTRHIDESGSFAESIYQAMARLLKPNVRGVRQGPFTVLAGTTMPAILVEIGYVSNKKDAKNFKSSRYLKRLSNAISSGIIEYARMIQEKKLRKVS